MRHILKQTLKRPECSADSDLRVGAGFIYRIWLQINEVSDRLALIDVVVDAILGVRNQSQMKSALKSAVSILRSELIRNRSRKFSLVSILTNLMRPVLRIEILKNSPHARLKPKRRRRLRCTGTRRREAGNKTTHRSKET